MSRGIIEAQTLRSEQFNFEARTSDPADAQPGEYWIRTDQTNTNPDIIAQLRRQDNSGVTVCPIFAASEESNLGGDVVRGPSVVLDDGSVGFVAMTTKSGAVGSPRAVTSAGTQYVSHNALELNPIPDSVVSRDADTNSISTTIVNGIEVATTEKWETIQAEISSNTSGFSTAYIDKLDSNGNVDTNIATVDISSLTSGDVVTFDETDLSEAIQPDTRYSFAIGDDYTVGFTADNGPYTSSDGVITIEGGTSKGQPRITITSNVHCFVRVGNIDL